MSTSRHQGMGRREFLTTSACALASAAVGPELLAGLAWQPRLIVAGFAPLGIESAGTDDFQQNVIAADRAGAGDRAFLRHGASVSMHGMSGEPRTRRAVEFLAHYTATDIDGPHVVPYYVWAGGGSPVRFTIPVDHDQRIRFSVTAPMPVVTSSQPATRRSFAVREKSAETAPTALPVELSLDGNVALRRGFFVIVPVYDGQSAPDWSAYSLRKDRGRWTLHGRNNAPASFEHFVVRVDYASPRVPREKKA